MAVNGNNRSSPPEVFCKKGVLRNFAIFTGKQTPAPVYFLIKLQASGFIKKLYQKRDPGIGVFL